MAIDSKLARAGVAPIAAAALLALAQPSIAQPLASLNDGPAMQATVRFVKDVGARGSPSFVLPDERVAAFGNSDGDLQMPQWATACPGPRFALIVHHADACGEWACERAPGIGELRDAMAEAKAGGCGPSSP